MDLRVPDVLLASLTVIAVSISIPTAGDASSPEFEWVHSCQAPDHERLGHELSSGAAAKRPASSDSAQTRTLRLIYFLPNDRTFNPDVVDTIKARMPRIQTFFRDQMQSNGQRQQDLRV